MNFKAITIVRGDETQGYDVTDYKATTVGEFVDEVLSGNGKKEWGYFEFIRVKPQKVGKWNVPPEWDRYEYKRGSLLDKIPDTLLNKRIERVTGDGGWSRMDYDITVVEENESGNETENVVRIGDRVFMDGTEVFKNIKGITYDTSGVSINKDVSINEDAKTPIEKAKELSNKYKELVEYSVEQCLIEMHEWDKERFIKWATEWLKHNIYDYFYWIEMEGESEANIKDTLYDNFKKYAEEQL